MVRIAAVLCAVFALVFTVSSEARVQPVPGPGAVVSMHRHLFRAIDAGDVEKALGYLHEDMHMDSEYRQRPCTLFLVDGGGAPLEAVGHDASRELMRRWIADEGSGWQTEITVGRDDCASGELSYAVLDFQRSRIVAGEQEIRRFKSTSLVTYDEGWKITHWHVSPASESL